MHLLVTRPEPDGELTAAKLRGLGFKAMVAPLLRMEPFDFDLGRTPWGAIALTSANAIRAVQAHSRVSELLPLAVFAVGAHTAEAARAAGFRDAVSADGNKDDLVRLIAAQYGRLAPLLYLAGEDRAGDLEDDLVAAGVIVSTRIAYRVAPVAEVPADVRDALGSDWLEGVLHFSRRSADVYVDLTRRAGILDKALALSHYCLSRQVAEPLWAAGAKNVRLAARPTEADLLGCIRDSRVIYSGSRSR